MATGMASDVSTFALWTFEGDAADGEVDLSPNGNDLALVSTGGTCPSVPGLIGNARHVEQVYDVGPNGARFVLPTSEELVYFLAGGGGNAWTIEALVRFDGGGGAVLSIADPASANLGCTLRAGWNYVLFGGNDGSAPGNTPEQSLATELPADEWLYLALCGGNTHENGEVLMDQTLYFFVNGVLRGVAPATVGGVPNALGALGSELCVGDRAAGGGTFANVNAGMDFCELRLSTTDRTPAEIAAQAIAYGLLGAGAADEVAPAVSDVTPAAGVPLDADEPIAFKVTDASGNLTNSTVLCSYPDIAAFEVVYFDGAFGPQYSGTRSAIANGFQFSNVIRRGGWPAPPTIIADAIDDAGNPSA